MGENIPLIALSRNESQQIKTRLIVPLCETKEGQWNGVWKGEIDQKTNQIISFPTIWDLLFADTNAIIPCCQKSTVSDKMEQDDFESSIDILVDIGLITKLNIRHFKNCILQSFQLNNKFNVHFFNNSFFKVSKFFSIICLLLGGIPSIFNASLVNSRALSKYFN